MARISNMPPASAADVQGTDSTYLYDANGARKDKRLTIAVLAEVVSEGLTVAPSSISTEGAAEGQALILTDGEWTPGTIPTGGGGGSGDVAGPAGAENARVAVFSGTSGKAIADSGYTAATLPVSGPTQTALDAISTTVTNNAATAASAAAAAQTTANTAQSTASSASSTATSAAAAAAAAQATADGKAALVHEHEIADVATLADQLAEMQLAIAALQNAGTFGTFLDPMWSIATGSGPGEVTVSISSFPLSTRPVNSIGYRIDDVAYSVPVTAEFTIQTNAPGASADVEIRVEESIAAGGEWSDPKSATAGAAVAPSAFDDDDWAISGGSGTEMVTVTILSLPYDGGAAISAIEIQYNSTGSYVALSGTGPGTYNVAATGITGAATGRLRAVNSVGNGTASPTKPVTVPGGDTAPAQFADTQWSFGPGTLPGSYALNIISLPGDGGSAITAIEYSLDGGSNWTALTGTGTGERQLTGFTAGAVNSAEIRAVNTIDPGPTTAATKSATARAGSALVGGTVTEANGFRVHTLDASGDVVVHGADMDVEYEEAGGGGGGGYGRGGGGGGGQVKRSTDAGAGPLTLTPGTHSFVRGDGGVGASTSNTNGANGGTSTFGGISALGGGGGAGAVGVPGETGGSGGGGRGGADGNSSAGGAANGTGTNAGGAGSTNADSALQNGGGGGGAGGGGRKRHVLGGWRRRQRVGLHRPGHLANPLGRRWRRAEQHRE